MNLETKKAPASRGIVIGLALGAVMGALSGFSELGFVLAPAFLGFVLGSWGYAAGAVSFAAFGIAAYFVAGISAFPYVLGAALPASAVIGYVIYNKKPWRTAVALGALLMGIGLYAYICLPSILEGQEPFYAIESFISAFSQDFTALAQSTGMDQDKLSYVRTGLLLYEEMAERMTMRFICTAAMFFALIDTLIARAFTRRTGRELRPMAPMPLWQLSRNFTYAAGAAILGAVATLLLQLNNSESVLEAAQQVVLGPLALMGLCYLDFSTRLGRPGSKAKRIIIYVLIVLVPYRTNILALVGLMDKMLKTRTRFVPNDKAK